MVRVEGTGEGMRKYQKNQCLEMIGLLDGAHQEVAGFIEKRHTEEALALLEQCQQSAISIGTLVESVEGEGTLAVGALEEYCELVYQFHEQLSGGISVNPWQMKKKLSRPLRKAENELKDGIPTRREVVFLPYKVSMWDSLESVWRAAREDPDCDAYVVPIPYYDRNPDGSFGKMHDERDQYPEEVPVVPYDAYDFESRHPDAVFIHNPYDDGNYVTSVHPFFYSKNLKQYTDDLVYIPYFVLQEIDPSDSGAVSGMEHFCMTAGVIHADHVIVQSENMRQVYVNVLTKYTGEEKRSYWQKKILGLGSPKTDRVCSLAGRDFSLPEEWEKLIRRENGRKRKVIFYNTGVTALLQDGEEMLGKIERNLRIFEENRENVILLWRPHPLSEATLASMRPRLVERYRRIVGEYRAAGWGIYDDTPEMDRAIAISDAYYGDNSSVVWLYQQTGKPVMIQSAGV